MHGNLHQSTAGNISAAVNMTGSISNVGTGTANAMTIGDLNDYNGTFGNASNATD